METQTISQILAPFKNIFESQSYQSFVKRWSDKNFNEKEIRSLGSAVSTHSFLFQRPKLMFALAGIEADYKKMSDTRTQTIFMPDDEFKKRILIEIPENTWKTAVRLQFDRLTTVNTRTELGKMVYKLFFSSITILNTEQKRIREREEVEVLQKFIEEDTGSAIDVSTLTLEEQVEYFHLHWDTYF